MTMSNPHSITTDQYSYSQDEDNEEEQSLDDHNNTNNTDDDNDDNDEEEEDDKLLNYLFDKSFLNQHIIAIFIALFATAIRYVYMEGGIILPNSSPSSLSSSSSSSSTNQNNNYRPPMTTPSTSSTTDTIISNNRKKIRSLKPTAHHHHHSYRRTKNLIFCPADYVTPHESKQQRIQRLLKRSTSDKNDNNNDIDDNLKLFQFNYPKKYIDLMKLYFVADDIMDDQYDTTLSFIQQYQQLEQDTMNTKEMISILSQQGEDTLQKETGSMDPNFKCLFDTMTLNEKKSTVPMFTVGYVHPDVETYYQNESTRSSETNELHLSNYNNNNNNKKNNAMKPADLSYKGFTAKFTNLSPKPVHLYWDSRTKPKFVGIIQPFASFTTATFPGNSFHITPTYNTQDALQRWTITQDESILYHDPYDEGKKVHDLLRLPIEHVHKYNMHQLNRIYAREYLAETQRSWLSTFPRPMNMHNMWDATYLGQEHIITTKQTHFNAIKDNHDDNDVELWKRLDYQDYDDMAEEQSRGNDNAFVSLPQYRESGTMDLKLTAISAAPRVFEIQNFLSPMEVSHLLSLSKTYNVTSDGHKESMNLHTPDLIKDERKKRKRVLTNARSNAWIRRETSPIVDSIYQRVANVLGIDESLLRNRNEHEDTGLNKHHSIAEAMHISQYVQGQGYSPRLDGAQPSIMNRYQPNRFATIMFFLNDGSEMEGGELNFPLAVTASNHDGVTVKPKLGKAVVFYNVLPDGNLDDFSQHTSKIVESGEKWMGTLFVWDPIID